MGYFESIYSDENLPHRAKAVYMYLKDRANQQGQCWPGINTARLRSNGGTTSILYTVKQAQFPAKG